VQPEMQGFGLKNQFTCVVATAADGTFLPCQLCFQGSTDKALQGNIKYKPSSIQPAPGGKRKERQEAQRAGGKAKKTTSSSVPDFRKMGSDAANEWKGIASLAVTHDHWADVNTSKSWVQDVLFPYYEETCRALGVPVRSRKCVLLVDCWWGWLDEEFRTWLKSNHPYVLLLFVLAGCTPVGQPNDAGIIANLEGEFFWKEK